MKVSNSSMVASNFTYPLAGLHCAKCVGRVQAALAPFAEQVIVSLSPMQVQLTGIHGNAALGELQNAVRAAGSYELLAQAAATQSAMPASLTASPPGAGEYTNPSWLETYRPLLLILAFIFTASILVQLGQHAGHGMGFGAVSSMETMRYFMAGFFLVFAFFKLLDVKAFADAYAGYDLIAARWPAWGRIYPFVELGLGVAYLANFAPRTTLWLTLLVMGASAIGVIRAVLDKRRIRCACLGSVFQLPMSTVTIVEDVGMVLMAGVMLALL